MNLEFKSKGSPSVVEALGGIHGVAFISDIKAAVGKILPDVPNDDGTYTLQCTVDDGVAAYRWV
ncbi:MAG: hypothetical protein LBT32_03380 [Peptococcaceae bacterium]|nr:hypothetical protein [Peptococcaceae bacterium]